MNLSPTAASRKQIIRADSAQWLIRKAIEHDFSTERLLADTGLEIDWIHRKNASISYDQYCKLIENTLDESGDLGIGLKFGRKINVTEFGFFGYALMSCQTMAEASQVGMKFWELGGQLLNLSITQDDHYLVITFFPATPLVKGRILIYAVEEDISSTISGFAFIMNQPLPVEKIHLSYSAPGHRDLYLKEFDCPAYFDQSENQIFLNPGFLDLPIPTANAEVAALVKRQCEELLLNLQRSDQFVEKVRRVLIDSLGHFPNSSEMARKLGVSSSSFYRQLKDRNTSFQKILDEVRTEIAMKYLAKTNLTIDQISDLIGFSETTTFRRAFKKWTGQTASEFRKTISL
jgi:AraC-like DNA-binding protein